MERLRGAWPILAATLLLAAIGATIVADRAHAQMCSPVCLPPPEEQPGEELPLPSPTPTPAPGPIRALVVNVGWGDGSSSTDSPLRADLLSRYVSYINGSVNEWFTRSAPPGAFRGWAAEAGGSYDIGEPRVPASCNEDAENSFGSSVISRTQLKLEQQGVNYEKYNLTVIVYDRLICFRGFQTGNRALVSEIGATTHELGHFLGLGHGNRLRCEDPNGGLVPLSANCEELEYGDLFDPMGEGGDEGRSFNKLPFSAAFANRLGWLNGQYIDVRAPKTGMYLIKPFMGSGFSGQRAIRLQDGPTTLWIEYRRPVGLDGGEDSPLLTFPFHSGSGVFIRREVSEPRGPFSSVPATQLLDMGAGRGGGYALERGRTFSNLLGESTVALNGTTSSGAVITIGSRRTATVPNVIGLDPARAAAVIAGAGLWSQGFRPVIDQTCSNIGVVSEQEPFPGVKVIPGTEVRLGVGEHPPFACP